MKSNRLFAQKLSRIMFTLVLTAACLAASAQAATYKVIHDFTGPDGATPNTNLILDASGNLYGVTTQGGKTTGRCPRVGCGTVFRLSPTSNGRWTTTVLHYFTAGADGVLPFDGLIFDSSGNLYGTAISGGLYGLGVVFELSPTSAGGWNETLLYNFSGGSDGGGPLGLTFDAAGNLYGTAVQGGLSCDCGVVFKLSPNSSGAWTQSVLYSFHGFGFSDGGYPNGRLIFDAAGNLYGTSFRGGLSKFPYSCYNTRLQGCGVVFELSPSSSSGWTLTILYSFSGQDGSNPRSGLIFDRSGNLYGTTQNGGILKGCKLYGCGVVYELSPSVSGGWSETVLRALGPGTGGLGDHLGATPFSNLNLDAAGNLYGTTVAGGSTGDGVVFRLSPNSTGEWTETVLHAFTGGTNGAQPTGLTFDAAGNLFGTTLWGGRTDIVCAYGPGCGVVFEITP